MNGNLLSLVITVAIAVFAGQFIYERLLQPRSSIVQNTESMRSTHMSVNDFLDNFNG